MVVRACVCVHASTHACACMLFLYLSGFSAVFYWIVDSFIVICIDCFIVICIECFMEVMSQKAIFSTKRQKRFVLKQNCNLDWKPSENLRLKLIKRTGHWKDQLLKIFCPCLDQWCQNCSPQGINHQSFNQISFAPVANLTKLHYFYPVVLISNNKDLSCLS